MPELNKSTSFGSMCKKVLLIGVFVAIIMVVVFGTNIPLDEKIVLFFLAFFSVTFFACCCAAAYGGDYVSDVTLASFKMVVVPTERDDVYLTKYSLPEQCFQCGADMSTKVLKLTDNLTVACPSCNKEIPCEGKFDSMPME